VGYLVNVGWSGDVRGGFNIGVVVGLYIKL